MWPAGHRASALLGRLDVFGRFCVWLSCGLQQRGGGGSGSYVIFMVNPSLLPAPYLPRTPNLPLRSQQKDIIHTFPTSCSLGRRYYILLPSPSSPHIMCDTMSSHSAHITSSNPQVIDGQYLDQQKLMRLLKDVYGTSDEGRNNFRVEVRSSRHFLIIDADRFK